MYHDDFYTLRFIRTYRTFRYIVRVRKINQINVLKYRTGHNGVVMIFQKVKTFARYVRGIVLQRRLVHQRFSVDNNNIRFVIQHGDSGALSKVLVLFCVRIVLFRRSVSRCTWILTQSQGFNPSRNSETCCLAIMTNKQIVFVCYCIVKTNAQKKKKTRLILVQTTPTMCIFISPERWHVTYVVVSHCSLLPLFRRTGLYIILHTYQRPIQ